VDDAVTGVGVLFDQAGDGLLTESSIGSRQVTLTPSELAARAAGGWASAFVRWAYRPQPTPPRRSGSHKVATFAWRVVSHGETVIHADLLRDIFGNPFRSVALDRAWLTSTVVALARGIYADRAFDRMTILADALQDAGCDNEDVLNHCRVEGPHVRGCWVIDLLTGRE
jgi:hypothetical protein